MAGTMDSSGGHGRDEVAPSLPPPVQHAPTLPPSRTADPASPATHVHPVTPPHDTYLTGLAVSRARQRHEQRGARTFWVVVGLALAGAAAVAVVATRSRPAPSADPAAAVTTPPVSAGAAATTAAPVATAPVTLDIRTLPTIGAPLPPAPAVVAGPAERTFDFLVRRYDTASPDSPAIEHGYLYDTTLDVGRVLTSSDGQPKLTFTQFDTTHRLVAYPDGALERIPRSAASLSPEPDIWLARRLGQSDLVPEVARPFTTIVHTEPSELDGDPVNVVGALFDIAAFAAQYPTEHAEWVWRWAAQTPFDPALIEPSGRQLAQDPPVRNDDPIPPIPMENLEIAIDPNTAAVLYMIDEGGSIRLATVINPVDGFRTVYFLGNVSEVRLSLVGAGRYDWVDAPA